MEGTTNTTNREPALLTEDEFAELYPRLRRFAAIVADWAEDPDDLVQDALARLLRVPRPALDTERYLRATIANLAIDRGRRHTRWRERAPRLVGPSRHHDAYPAEFDILDGLSPVQRAVVWLADVEAWTFEEIGGLLGIRPSTARQHASRARARIRRDLEGVDHDADDR